MENNMSNEDFQQDFDLKAEINKYLIHWKWFVLSVSFLLFGAFLKLRYTLPLYKAATKIIIKDERSGGELSQMAAFADLGINRGAKNVENEIEVLKSRTLIENTIEKLNFNISLIANGNLIDREWYDKALIKVHFLNQTPDFDNQYMSFDFNEHTSGKFSLSEHSKIIIRKKREYNFGEIIKTKYGDLIITKLNTVNNHTVKDLRIVVNPLENVVGSYMGRLDVSPLTKGSSVIVLSIIDPVVSKAESFLNTLVQTYNENGITDKNFISKNTAIFINNRLELISKELDGVEHDVENFKSSNRVVDVQSEAGLVVSGAQEYARKSIETEMQLNILASMITYLKKSTNSDLLPSNLSAGEASGLIGSYNELILDRNRVLKSATISNPTVLKLDQQIASLKETIFESLIREQSSLKIQKKNSDDTEANFNAKISRVPIQERKFRVIDRQQKVKEELYLYLLQKREETAIALSTTEPNVKVIDEALGYGPISPNSRIVYLGALAIGLMIPFAIIFLIHYLDTKIKSRIDLEDRTLIPFIGDVPTSDDSSQIMQVESRSSSAEALRIIRTNLEFMVSKVPDGIAKTIFLTSTFPKEGKTFVSVNLAATFALSGKKVLLIGLDIRNPKLDEYLSLPDRGITNYLSSKDLNLDDLIIKQNGYEDFYVLPAGIIPPNPAELLMSKKVDHLFEVLKKQYDYIIVDTAPVSLVTDTLLIAKHADTFIYVARANFLEKRMLDIPNGLYRENKLPNMCILLNDTDSTKGYGYGYGYGMKSEKMPWYKKKN